MLRASLTLLLFCASAAVFAQNGRTGAAGNATACQDIADRAVAERQSEAAPTTPDAQRARATAVRSKYASQATANPATSRGGGDDDTSSLPRSRGSKWHSFLPGMFR
ncbi:hypothetical protein [Pseudoxanthomonas putridarboris]|uniref:Secreted protein n=1 Tax=Pseudoxanthomonas putridarboris TaxID=752605 RepID=A0ABU9IV24_9GAMM